MKVGNNIMGENKMKIKKCCKDYDMIMYGDISEYDEKENIQPHIWHIPKGCWEEEGIQVPIRFCPMCGKKIQLWRNKK